jgi:hypothetical protein
MKLNKVRSNTRTVITVGSISLGSAGAYAFVFAGVCRIVFNLEETTAIFWIGIPIFIILAILHIIFLPPYLRKTGIIS